MTILVVMVVCDGVKQHLGNMLFKICSHTLAMSFIRYCQGEPGNEARHTTHTHANGCFYWRMT
jgi:hypothetical protein